MDSSGSILMISYQGDQKVIFGTFALLIEILNKQWLNKHNKSRVLPRRWNSGAAPLYSFSVLAGVCGLLQLTVTSVRPSPGLRSWWPSLCPSAPPDWWCAATLKISGENPEKYSLSTYCCEVQFSGTLLEFFHFLLLTSSSSLHLFDILFTSSLQIQITKWSLAVSCDGYQSVLWAGHHVRGSYIRDKVAHF